MSKRVGGMNRSGHAAGGRESDKVELERPKVLKGEDLMSFAEFVDL